MKHVSYILKACFSFENNDNMVVSNDIWKKTSFYGQMSELWYFHFKVFGRMILIGSFIIFCSVSSSRTLLCDYIALWDKHNGQTFNLSVTSSVIKRQKSAPFPLDAETANSLSLSESCAIHHSTTLLSDMLVAVIIRHLLETCIH